MYAIKAAAAQVWKRNGQLVRSVLAIVYRAILQNQRKYGSNVEVAAKVQLTKTHDGTSSLGNTLQKKKLPKQELLKIGHIDSSIKYVQHAPGIATEGS